MRCQDCSRPADVEVESGGVIVGLCEEHLRERVESLADEWAISVFREILDPEES